MEPGWTDGTAAHGREIAHETPKLRRGKQCRCELTAWLDWLVSSELQTERGLCKSARERPAPGQSQWIGCRQRQAGNLDGMEPLCLGRCRPPKRKPAARPPRSKGKAPQRRKSEIGGHTSHTGPRFRISDHFRILIACWKSWDCNPKPVAQRTPLQSKPWYIQTRNGTARSCATENQVRLEKQASIPSLLRQAGGRASTASKRRKEGTRSGGTLQAAQHAQQHPTACSVARCPLLVQALRASSQFQNLLFAVHDQGYTAPQHIQAPASEKLCPFAQPAQSLVRFPTPVPSFRRPVDAQRPDHGSARDSTTLLDGRIDEPWQPRPSRVRCPPH